MTLVSLLPENWERLAHEHRLLETKFGNAKITNADELLRLILVHAAADQPLRQTVALVAAAGCGMLEYGLARFRCNHCS